MSETLSPSSGLISMIDGSTVAPSFIETVLLHQFDSMTSRAALHTYSSILGHLPRDGALGVISAFISDNVETLSTLISLIIEWRALQSGDGTLIEHLFGLCRVPVKMNVGQSGRYHDHDNRGGVEGDAMSMRQRQLSALLVVLVPRLLSSLKTLHQRRTSLMSNNTGVTTTTTTTQSPTSSTRMPNSITHSSWGHFLLRLKDMMVEKSIQCLPVLQGGYDAVVWYYHIMYLFDRTPYSHPLLAILNLQLLRKSSITSNQTFTLSPSSSPTPTPTPSISSSSTTSPTPPPSNTDWKTIVIIAAVVSIRAAQWFANNSRSGMTRNLLANPTRSLAFLSSIPAPSPHPVGSGCVIPPNNSQLCPLCRQLRTHPAASTSGYVFCFDCLSRAINSNPSCPVTGQPCRQEDILRLYEQGY